MHILKALLIFRPVNLLILAATQLAVYFYLITGNGSNELLNPLLVRVVIATLLLAMAGNLHNDLVDVVPDGFNKPGRNYSVYWPSRSLIWVLYCILTFLSILIPFMIIKSLGLIFLIMNVLLLLYNYQIKKIPLLGNLVIAFLSGFSLIIIGLVFPNVENGPLFFYSGFAFLITLIREIVKDAQDMNGDKEAGFRTLPLLIGTRRTNRAVANLSVFTVVLFITLGFENIDIWFAGSYRIVVILYAVTGIILPLGYLTYIVARNNDVNYSQLSRLLKYVMVTGLASMLFF